MTKRVDSDALTVANKALGLFGVSALAETEFLDGELVQQINVLDIIRRGRTLAGSTGIFGGTLQNAHGGGGDLQSSETPYDIQTAVASPWPNPLPDLFDLWLLAVGMARTSGAAVINAAGLMVQLPGVGSWGTDDNGAAISVATKIPVATWPTSTSILDTFGLVNTVPLPMRLQRGCTLNFQSDVSAAATLDCNMIFGIFPVSLGQDVVGR